MKRLIALACLSLSLSGCALLPTLLGGGAPASPAAVANQTVLDEKVGIAVESMYVATTRAGALAFRAGLVDPSSDAAVQSDDFCPKVLAKLYEPTDRGSAVMAVECKLRMARDTVRRTYAAGNAQSYDVAAREAIALSRELLALIRGN